ncbi:hypothetical protein [Crateriforma conspicua]|uniref:hypothetical protein n=1 Tax=Crateriforma TaxID=2714592 RepID=UPI0018CE19B8|nr:hypothetical protein [Crateriforma conspicua]
MTPPLDRPPRQRNFAPLSNPTDRQVAKFNEAKHNQQNTPPRRLPRKSSPTESAPFGFTSIVTGGQQNPGPDGSADKADREKEINDECNR